MTFLDECKRWTRSSIPGRKIFEANNLFDHSKTRERSASTGHAKKRPASETGQEKFEIIVENRVVVSQRKLANKFLTKFEKMDVKYYLRQKAPTYSEKQLDMIPKRWRKLRREVMDRKTHEIVDEEKYFNFCSDGMPGNSG